MAYLMGFEGKLYYGAAGATATNELTNCRNVTLTLERSEADVTTRGSGDIEETAAGRKKIGVEFEQVWDPDDPGFAFILSAYANKTTIAILCLDEAGGIGLDADCKVLNFTRSEPDDGPMTAKVTVKPTRSTRAPVLG